MNMKNFDEIVEFNFKDPKSDLYAEIKKDNLPYHQVTNWLPQLILVV
jgi:hypothetical protein